MRFSFSHSHAFPGGRVVVEDDGAAEGACEVEFADGVTVIGSWRREDDAFILDAPAYRTARGTEVAGRRWRVARNRNGEWRSQRMA